MGKRDIDQIGGDKKIPAPIGRGDFVGDIQRRRLTSGPWL
jgi:hypothetical protein